MATLYELTSDYMNLLEMAEDPDTDPEVLQDTMEAIEGEIECKADNYARVIAQLKGESTALDGEIKRLNARKDSIDKNSDRIKQTLTNAMNATGKRKFKTDYFSFYIQMHPASVVMDEQDIEKIPDRYRVKQPDTIDKRTLKSDIEAGDKEAMKIAHLEAGEGVRIR